MGFGVFFNSNITEDKDAWSFVQNSSSIFIGLNDGLVSIKIVYFSEVNDGISDLVWRNRSMWI